MTFIKNTISLASLLIVIIMPTSLVAEETSNARLYRSPEERRDAGLGHKVTEWLEVSGLVEVETEYEKDRRLDRSNLNGLRESSQNVQLGLDIALSENVIAEIVFEYELDRDHGELDEAVLEYETDHWSLKFGRESIDFGEYFSHFSTGPLLEFGETRADNLTLGYKFSPRFEIFGLAFEGRVNQEGQRNQIDYGGGFDFTSKNEQVSLGLNYLSDLAETDEQFLAGEGNRAQTQVSGFSAYLLLSLKHYEITAEVVKALEKFKALEPGIDQPMAWNLELAWMPRPKWQLAFRVEGSSELEEEPEQQMGFSSSWLIGNVTHLTVDYLYGEYKTGFVEDDDENELRSRQSASIQLSIEF